MAGAPTDHHADHDYERGSMDISEHESTWRLFIGIAKWGSLLTAVAVAMLTIWFMPGGSFLGGLTAAVVIGGAGWWFLKK